MKQNLPSFNTHEELLKTSKFIPANDILYRQVENEAILLHITSGTYYSLNATSIPFWEALQKQQPLEQVIEETVAEYDVERSQVLQDLQAFLQELSDLGLISVQ